MALMWYWLVCLVVLGAVVGSFLNVCIYRLPWEKSVVWPGSHCPKCLRAVRAYDNIPVLSWFILRGRCRDCGAWFSPRYMLLEALTAVFFGAVFWLEVIRLGGPLGRYIYHIVLVAALIVATFIDFDLQIIPDSVTIPTTLFGLVGATLIPDVHVHPIQGPAPDPIPAPLVDACWSAAVIATGWALWVYTILWLARCRAERLGAAEVVLLTASFAYLAAQSAVWIAGIAQFAPAWPGWPAWFAAHPHWHGLATSLTGLLVSAGLIFVVRVAGRAILGKEAMGFGDVTLMAMIGSFLGWQPALIIFFAAPFLALITGVVQWITKGEHVLPYGPYLAMAAAVTMLAWPSIWPVVQLHFQLLAMIPVHWGVIIALPPLVWCLWRADRK